MKNELYIFISGLNPEMSKECEAFLLPRIEWFTEFPCFAQILDGESDKKGKPLVQLPNGCVVSLVLLEIWVEKP